MQSQAHQAGIKLNIPTLKKREMYSCIHAVLFPPHQQRYIYMFIKLKEMDRVTTNTNKLTCINISVTTKGGLTNFGIICIDNNLTKSNENNY